MAMPSLVWGHGMALHLLEGAKLTCTGPALLSSLEPIATRDLPKRLAHASYSVPLGCPGLHRSRYTTPATFGRAEAFASDGPTQDQIRPPSVTLYCHWGYRTPLMTTCSKSARSG